MYIRLDADNIVREIIPDIDPIFPAIPIEERYPAAFVASLMYVEDGTAVAQNLLYDKKIGTFVEPPEPASARVPEVEIESEPSAEDDRSSLLIDQEYRLTLLELGL